MSERLTSFSEILAPLERTKESLSMSQKKISGGVVHQVPADLKKALTSDPQALTAWEDITPLARNEWICWIESAKKAETRSRRIEWGCSSLKDGKRRPCCWPFQDEQTGHCDGTPESASVRLARDPGLISTVGVFTSASPRGLDRGDVDLLHRHHRLEGTLCLAATSRKRIG